MPDCPRATLSSDFRVVGSLVDGTVAERTIAPALKAGGRKARGFESLPFRWLVLCRIGLYPCVRPIAS
jgi:hypothetical protein